jgi:hypothetical protein
MRPLETLRKVASEDLTIYLEDDEGWMFSTTIQLLTSLSAVRFATRC